LFGGNAPFVEELYEKYLADPASVPEEWRGYFDKLQLLPGGAAKDVAHAPIVEFFASQAKTVSKRAALPADLDRKQVSVIQLVAEYRFRGCLLADLDPLKRQKRPHIPELEAAYYDLGEADMDTVFNTGTFMVRSRPACAKSSARCRKPTAARWASSTCTSPAAWKSAGSRSALSRCARSRASPPTTGSTFSSA